MKLSLVSVVDGSMTQRIHLYKDVYFDFHRLLPDDGSVAQRIYLYEDAFFGSNRLLPDDGSTAFGELISASC